jgi:hypothetical protein
VAGFALESRKDALGKWWGSGSQQLTQIAGATLGGGMSEGVHLIHQMMQNCRCNHLE